MLCEQERPLLTARGTEVEAFAAERAKVVVIAIRIGALDSGDSLKVIAAGTESFSNFLDAFESESTILLGIPFLELIAEIFKVFLKDLMELISPTWDVLCFDGCCR
jgi:hypothetical protein